MGDNYSQSECKKTIDSVWKQKPGKWNKTQINKSQQISPCCPHAPYQPFTEYFFLCCSPCFRTNHCACVFSDHHSQMTISSFDSCTVPFPDHLYFVSLCVFKTKCNMKNQASSGVLLVKDHVVCGLLSSVSRVVLT